MYGKEDDAGGLAPTNEENEARRKGTPRKAGSLRLLRLGADCKVLGIVCAKK